jgi:acyl dehydratase
VRSFASVAELEAVLGQEVGVSDWIVVDQRRIDAFADATDDHQWIHVDAERCRRESPYRTTIAHGFLTVSLIPGLFEHTLRLEGARMVINYGLNKLRFPAPVPVDSRVRARFVLASLTPVEGAVQLAWQVTIEREGAPRPVCVAELLLRRFD